MKAGGNKTRYVTHGALRSAGKQVNEVVLLCRINGEDVDQCNELLLLGNNRHRVMARILLRNGLKLSNGWRRCALLNSQLSSLNPQRSQYNGQRACSRKLSEFARARG
jgi:hypothetical protein